LIRFENSALYCLFFILLPHCITCIIGETNKMRVITKLPNSEQSYKGKVKAHKYINRQNQSTTGKL
jgi:Na+(H+)/acetate symporter ActP